MVVKRRQTVQLSQRTTSAPAIKASISLIECLITLGRVKEA